MSKAYSITPNLSVSNTQGTISDQGISYNEAGLSYNEAGYTYGGASGRSDIPPIISLAKKEQPIASAAKTQRGIQDDGISYNESGISYNELGLAYGGLYGLTDIFPIIASVQAPKPSIFNYADIYTKGTTPISNNQSIGPGWFMFITQ